MLLQEFDERLAAAFEITTIRSFKYDPFFGGGGGGGGGKGRRGVDPIDLLLLFV